MIPQRAYLIRPFAAASLLVILVMLISSVPAQGESRFKVDAPIWLVNDNEPIDEPAVLHPNRIHALIDGYWLRPLDDRLALKTWTPAMDLNSIEEVPASSWFMPRIGKEPMAMGAVGLGCSKATADHLLKTPLTLVSGRLDGPSPSLLVKESDGKLCYIHFDAPGYPEMTTAALVVTNRILHAAGYHVFEAFITAIEPEDLGWMNEARKVNRYGGESALTEKDFSALISSQIEEAQGSSIRVAVERLPAGVIKGGFSGAGTRGDDLNDQIPHQHRRSLRGLRIIAAWLDWSDFNSDRTLDLYVPEGYLKHYLVHPSSALGAGRRLSPLPAGAETGLPISETGAVSQNGLARALGKPLVRGERHRFPGIGDLTTRNFDPLDWQPTYGFEPFRQMHWGDALWGAELVGAFSDQQIVEAVHAGKLSEKEARNYLVGTISERRDMVMQSWLTTINPADRFRIARGDDGRPSLVFTDMAIASGVVQDEDVLYTMEFTIPELNQTLGLQSHGGYKLDFDLSSFEPANWLHRRDPRRYGRATIRAYNYWGEALRGVSHVYIYFEAEGDVRVIGIERE